MIQKNTNAPQSNDIFDNPKVEVDSFFLLSNGYVWFVLGHDLVVASHEKGLPVGHIHDLSEAL